MVKQGDSGADRSSSALGLTLRLLGLALGLALFAWMLRDVDGPRLRTLLADVGPLAAIVLLPQALGTLFHTAAWRELLAGLGHRAPLFALTGTFVASEAARMALPAGPVVGEGVAAYHLHRRLGVPWTSALTSLAAKKAWVLCSHAACFLLLLLLGGAALRELGAALPGGELLPLVTVLTGAALGAGGALTLVLLSSRRAGAWLTTTLARLPSARMRAWAEAQRHRPDAAAASRVPPIRHALAGALMFAQWMTEIFETWLILRLLGIDVSFSEALLIELGGSMVRSLAFVVPGGLGVQDASYVGTLLALGVPGATEVGVTFVVLKRAKELFYIGLGVGVLTLGKRGPAPVEVTP